VRVGAFTQALGSYQSCKFTFGSEFVILRLLTIKQQKSDTVIIDLTYDKLFLCQQCSQTDVCDR